MIWNQDDWVTFLRDGEVGDELWMCPMGTNDPHPGGIVATIYQSDILIVFESQQMYVTMPDGGRKVVQVPDSIPSNLIPNSTRGGWLVFTSQEYPLSVSAKAEIDLVLATKGLR